MLTRIRNANVAFHDDVVMPSSKLKVALAKILEQEGYISGSSVEDDSSYPRPRLRIAMKYTPDRKRTISGLRRVSKPGLRVYTPADQLPRVLGGMGIAILSTNQGLMTDREARQRHVGGEVLCQVW
jgi:small subunit ribosomal protein S8